MKVFLRVILSVCLFALCATTMTALQQEQDELHLRTGAVLRGRLSEMDSNTIVFRTTEGIKTYSRNEVQIIVLGGTLTGGTGIAPNSPGTPNPAPAPTPAPNAGLPTGANAGGGFPQQPGRGAWRLRQVRVFNRLENTGTIVRDSYDANGGFSEVRLNGNLSQICPGGSEVVRLAWQFPTSAAAFNDGDRVNITISGDPLSRTGGCTGGLAARTIITSGGSNGNTNPFNVEESAQIDGGRFWDSQGGGRVFADPNATTRSTPYFFEVDTRPHYPERQRAWFNVKITTPAGEIRYVYIYEWGTPAQVQFIR